MLRFPAVSCFILWLLQWCARYTDFTVLFPVLETTTSIHRLSNLEQVYQSIYTNFLSVFKAPVSEKGGEAKSIDDTSLWWHATNCYHSVMLPFSDVNLGELGDLCINNVVPSNAHFRYLRLKHTVTTTKNVEWFHYTELSLMSYFYKSNNSKKDITEMYKCLLEYKGSMFIHGSGVKWDREIGPLEVI